STNAYSLHTVSISQVAAANGLSFTPNNITANGTSNDVFIRFTQYGSGVLGSAGIALDGIQVFDGGTISGLCYGDLNANGQFDPGQGEAGTSGRAVYVDANNDGQLNIAPPLAQ